MAKGYLPWNVDQRTLLPVDVRQWLPDGHLTLFVLDVVSELRPTARTMCRRACVARPGSSLGSQPAP